MNISNLSFICTNFILITIVYFISSALREGGKIFLEKLFINNIITKEKRSKPLFYFFDYLGYFLFLIFGVGYSNNKNITYKNYSFIRKFLFFLTGILINFVLILFIVFIMEKNFYFNKFQIIQKLYFYFIYINFILILINVLPFPFSDLFTFIEVDSYFYPLMLILQIIFIFLFFYFDINSILYEKFINFIKIFF